jgi:signal transduction protein with GAF and PtsI domain
MGDIDALTTALTRTEIEFRSLDEKRATLEKERAEIIRKTEAAAGDTETLAQLKIEIEWVAEAKRENDRLIAQATKRIQELEHTIAMQRQSDMN